MAVLTQLTTAGDRAVIGFPALHRSRVEYLRDPAGGHWIALNRHPCNRFLPFVFFSRTKGEWLVHWTFVLKA